MEQAAKDCLSETLKCIGFQFQFTGPFAKLTKKHETPTVRRQTVSSELKKLKRR